MTKIFVRCIIPELRYGRLWPTSLNLVNILHKLKFLWYEILVALWQIAISSYTFAVAHDGPKDYACDVDHLLSMKIWDGMKHHEISEIFLSQKFHGIRFPPFLSFSM